MLLDGESHFDHGERRENLRQSIGDVAAKDKGNLSVAERLFAEPYTGSYRE